MNEKQRILIQSEKGRWRGFYIFPRTMVGQLLVLIMLIGLLPMAFVGWLGYSALHDEIRENRISDVGSVAENKHKLLTLTLRQSQQHIEEFLAINQSRCSTLFGPDGGKFDSCLRSALTAFVEREGALGGVIHRPGAEDIRLGIDGSANERALLPGQIAAFPPAQSQGERVFFIPVSDEKLLLSVTYPVALLQTVFDTPTELGRSGEAFLADAKGFFITRPRYASEQGHGIAISAKPMQHCLQQHTMQMLELDYRAEPIIHGFQYIPEIGGGCIMAHIEQQEAFASLQTLRRNAVFITLAMLLLVLSAAYYLNRKITRPLTDLCTRLAGVSDGTEKIEFSKEGPSEIVALGHSFAAMIKRMQSFIEGQMNTLCELIETNEKLEDAQNHLLQSEKMASIGQLAAGVAHEINNPIGYVYSNLGTLEKYVQDAFAMLTLYERAEDAIADVAVRAELKAAREKLDIAFLREDLGALMGESKEGITRVKTIVQNLKDFSHVDISDEWHLTDLRAGIESTLNIVNNEIKYKAEVVKEYGDLPEVECLSSQINQVFMNLLVNAAHAIEERGTITIRTGQKGNEVWVEIADTGKGIAPEHLKKIFDPFFTTKPIGQGTGLGLSLSYGIVQKHGGRIEVESVVGRGTTFRVWLPVKHSVHEPDYAI